MAYIFTSAKVLDGRKLAVTQRVAILADSGVQPGLAVVLVGDDPASAVYVRNKIRACEGVGVRSFSFRFAAEVSQAELLGTIIELNSDPAVHGVLVQLPLPPHIDLVRVLETIAVEKDVDGFHLYNVGGLVTGSTISHPLRPLE